MTGDKGPLLVLSYHFPPLGGIASLRAVKTVKHLARLGWRPTVLCARGPRYHAGGDPSLASEVPAGVEVLRLPAPEPGRLLSGALRRLGLGPEALERVDHACFIPDNKIAWLPFALAAGLRAARRRRPRAILAFGAPWTALLAGAALARASRIPLSAHFADEWTRNVWYAPATPVHARLHRLLERGVLRAASVVTMATEGMPPRFREIHPDLLPEGRVSVLPNGYDEEDFAGFGRPDPARFTIVHAGTLLVRVTDPRPFFRAYARFLSEDPGRRARARLRLLGFLDAPFREVLDGLGLGAAVSVEGSRPHADAVRALGEADVLALFLARYDGHACALHAKTGEYLRAGRPVLAAVPGDTPVAEALRAAGAEAPVDPEDEDALLARLRSLYARWEAGTLASAPVPPGVLARFDRARQARALSELLEKAAHAA